MIAYFIPPLSVSRVRMFLLSLFRACFSGGLVLGVAVEWTWQPQLGRSLPSAHCGKCLGRIWALASCRQVFPVRPEKKMGGSGDEDEGGDQRSPGARWIPWEEGGESCSPPGAPAPGSDFNSGRFCGSLSRLARGGGEGSAHRQEGVHRASGERLPTPGARALTRRPSGLSAPGRTALHQGATCLRAPESCARETTSPRPPGGRAHLCCLRWRPRAGIGGLQGDGRLSGHRGGRRVRPLLCPGWSGA